MSTSDELRIHFCDLTFTILDFCLFIWHKNHLQNKRFWTVWKNDFDATSLQFWALFWALWSQDLSMIWENYSLKSSINEIFFSKDTSISNLGSEETESFWNAKKVKKNLTAFPGEKENLAWIYNQRHTR